MLAPSRSSNKRLLLRYLDRLSTHAATFRALADLRVWFFRGLARGSAGGLGFRRAGDLLASGSADATACVWRVETRPCGRADGLALEGMPDGHVVDVGSTRSVSSLVRIALRFGFRKTGQQAFVRISSNRTWGEISKEPFVVDFFARAQRLGLY